MQFESNVILKFLKIYCQVDAKKRLKIRDENISFKINKIKYNTSIYFFIYNSQFNKKAF